jgi:uncharacterized membrane protein
MAAPARHLNVKEGHLARIAEAVRRAFAEFLKLPCLIIAGFLLLAAGTSVLDHAYLPSLQPARAAMRVHFFRDGKATSDLLATIAGSIITITSITFSLLLLAVQQAASGLTPQVYDQFLRRRVNQVYFGFFVGLAMYALIVLATVNAPYNPVFGASVALVLTMLALLLMILLLYTTINQMRPDVVIDAIHDHVLIARDCQLAWLGRIRRSPRGGAAMVTAVQSEKHGYVVRIDMDALGNAAKAHHVAEIVLRVSVGAFVAFEDTMAEAGSDAPLTDDRGLVKAVQQAIHVEQRRDLDTDPAYGIEQLAIIGWTTVSTAKSNPSPGLLVLHSLRDLLARWSAVERDDSINAATDEKLPVVYNDDVFAHLLDAFETLAVVASESMQPQTMAELVRTFGLMFERLPADHQPRAEDVIRRSLSALGEHVLTAELNAALSALIQSLEAADRHQTAAQVRAAQHALSASVGQLGSRATRMSANR